MTTVIRASDSAQLLSVVPALAGFTPRDSLVVLPFEGARTHGAMRVDLPAAEADAEAFADAIFGLVDRVAGCDGVALVIYTPQLADDGTAPFSALLAALAQTATDRELRLIDALCVTDAGWGSYLERTFTLRSVAEILPTPELPGVGDVSGDQDAGVALPRPTGAARAEVATHLRALERAHPGQGTPRPGAQPADAPGARAVADLPRFFDSILDRPHDPEPEALATLLWALARPALRDVALLQWASDRPGGERVLDEQVAFLHNRSSVSASSGLTFMGEGPRPDPDRLRLALAVVRLAAAHAPRRVRSAPLCAAAWLSWALGRSSHAMHYLGMARAIRPDDTFRDLLAELFRIVELPRWCFRMPARTPQA